jgi:low temperature requirement protein LtrA
LDHYAAHPERAVQDVILLRTASSAICIAVSEATPLELLFDLSFAAAVAQAGQQLVHALAEGEPGHGITGCLLVFFAIWWAWVNFTWFTSARSGQ